VARKSVLAAQVLELYHGDEGAKWSHCKRGRSAALYRLTKSGRELIARARRMAAKSGSVLALSDADRLKVEIALDETVPEQDDWRRAKLRDAEMEATALYQRATAEWERAKEE
jgi:predicted ArsR family transcriptional regulator